VGRVGVLTGMASGPPLAEEIPALVEGHLDRLQAGFVGVVEALGVAARLEQSLLLGHELVDAAEQGVVVHAGDATQTGQALGMSAREFIVLGTASQAPTRHRNHNGYLLRWDAEGVLFDPGEGTQRQLLLAGVASSAIARICITHFHGDHCLGLPGILQRLSLHRVAHPVDVWYPAGGQEFYDRLRRCALYDDTVDVRPHPVFGDCREGQVNLPSVVDPGPEPFALVAARLDHRTETIGWRVEEPAGRRMLPERLAAAGISGPDVGRLQREGSLVTAAGRTVTLAEMSEPRRGQVFAFVMDTRLCDAALALADGADLLVCESTFLDRDAGLAAAYGHLTAAQAARVAAEAGARQLVLTHFSQRYPDDALFAAEAGEIFPDVVAVRDLDRVPVPPRAG
jgi:ribonuclease Z